MRFVGSTEMTTHQTQEMEDIDSRIRIGKGALERNANIANRQYPRSHCAYGWLRVSMDDSKPINLADQLCFSGI